MTKQNKLFSWLGFGKKPSDAPDTATQPESTAANATATTETPAAATPVADAAVTAAPVTDAPAADVPVQENPAAAQQADSSPALVTAAPAPAAPTEAAAPKVNPILDNPKKPGLFARLKQGLAKTSLNLGAGLASLFVGKKIDDELYEELETQLLLADVGMDTTQKLIKQLTSHADRKALKDAGLLYEKLQQDMAELLQHVEQPLQPEASDGPFVILMVGVNGVGKTTTIGKMAQQFKQQGKTVMLAAGDTFRAAAVEQLQVWGERNQIPVIAQHTGADSASVIFDAYQAAKARKVDVLIADTAGRLQNKAHLMEELKKIVRVLQKIEPAAPHEVMLTLDAGTGQNALSQAKLFNEAVPLTGISLTKLDGTAKGGVIFAIADQFKVPIRFIGVGEAIDDLRQFQAQDFIRALFNKE
ncbi:signal recognition particle-docking protein FtsY [Alishewanella jeotgali]|jgi:fused signal recognition particle receptor|uniref:Signal recognition particle receptor FtsY n=1 Tax=Alishewanella jeotgali KCTC 22429 TaxID=1129374 RepID=H3ZCW0_9ALTE|nr:signal recognition particle-docking protein FtsY [Alishewanella jeotgali]EHR41549.1 cell division transporter substrate-binding protein [Alishewanella jeotgali KCTC 22429]